MSTRADAIAARVNESIRLGLFGAATQLALNAARRGQMSALTQIARSQDRHVQQSSTLEKRPAKDDILRLEAEGVPRDVIAWVTGCAYDHILDAICKGAAP
jgi:hypothetical protein